MFCMWWRWNRSRWGRKQIKHDDSGRQEFNFRYIKQKFPGSANYRNVKEDHELDLRKQCWKQRPFLLITWSMFCMCNAAISQQELACKSGMLRHHHISRVSALSRHAPSQHLTAIFAVWSSNAICWSFTSPFYFEFVLRICRINSATLDKRSLLAGKNSLLIRRNEIH